MGNKKFKVYLNETKSEFSSFFTVDEINFDPQLHWLSIISKEENKTYKLLIPWNNILVIEEINI